MKQLDDFIRAQETKNYDEETDLLVHTGKDSLEEVTKEWETWMREEMADFGEKRCASDEELFATAYHKMVHSPALETMLQLEHMYAQTVRQRTEEKDHLIKKLNDR